jgi:transglutaminase-like putative cysteine protease
VNTARLHRRLVVLVCLAALLAFAGGAGAAPLSTGLAAVGLLTALIWQPSPSLSRRLERLWLPLAILLVLRAGLHILTVTDGDLVVPVVDLLLLLMCAEALRSLDAPNDGRLYALSFALILASTAYRPDVLFAIAFAAYVIIGTVALIVGHLRRKGEQYGVGRAPVSPRLLAGAAASSLVILFASAAVFLTFPRVSQAWSGRGESHGRSLAGFSDRISLGEHGARIYSNPEVVLRIEFPDGRPVNTSDLHWRGRSYDHFDGVVWSRSRELRPSAGTVRWYRAWSDSVIRQNVYAEPLDRRVLFALHPVLNLDARSNIYPLFDAAGDFVYWGSDVPSYLVVSAAEPPSPEALRMAETGFMPDGAHYLQLPELPVRIGALADSLAGDLPTRYDKVRTIESWLRTEFRYTLDLPARASETSLDHFLFERRAGHCEYFSTAMVVLLRSLGIHARNVNGFLGGRWSDLGEYLAVTQNEAHSWVEVWFPNYGWVTFDPTPSGGRGDSGAGSWLWPGRFLVDAFQHRWSTWVLDFDGRSQFGILDRLRSASDDVRQALEGEAGTSPSRVGPALLITALALVLAGAAYVTLLRPGRSGLPPESRLYLRLVRVCQRAGLGLDGSTTPLQLVTRLQERAHPAADPAGHLVDRYLKARFAGERTAQDTLGRMARDVRAVRRLLRQEPWRPS